MSKQFLGFRIADYWHVEIFAAIPLLILTALWMWRVLDLLQAISKCAL